MKSRIPPPQANVDDVLPELIEQARRQRERNANASGTSPAECTVGPDATAPAHVPRSDDPRDLRAELRRTHWVLALLLVAVAVLLLKVFF